MQEKYGTSRFVPHPSLVLVFVCAILTVGCGSTPKLQTPGSGNWTRAVAGSAPSGQIPEQAVLLYNKGNDQFAREDFRGAAKSFSQAIDIFPTFGEAYDNRGIIHRRLGEFEKALADHTKAIELNPSIAWEALNNRAHALLAMKRYNEAIADLTRATEINPNNAIAFNTRGAAYSEMGKYQEAIEDYSKAVRIKPDYWEAYYNRGFTYTEYLKEYQKAVGDYTKALELKSDLVRGYHNRAVAWFFLQQYDKAWDDVAQCQRMGVNPHPRFIEALKRASGR